VIGFVGAERDALELFEFAKEVLDQMTSLVNLGVNFQGLGAAWMLRDDDLGPALVQICNDRIAVEGFVGDQATKLDPFDQWRHADGVEAMPGQQHKANQTSKGVCERQYLGGHAALGATYGLARSPPFAP
jgi:hypothetical protein